MKNDPPDIIGKINGKWCIEDIIKNLKESKESMSFGSFFYR